MRCLSLVLALLIVSLTAHIGSDRARAQAAAQSPGDWIQGCEKTPELCVPRCQRDPLFCARQINAYLLEEVKTKDGKNRPRFETLTVYPGQTAARVNTTTPMHGAFLTIRVNDIALKYVNHLGSLGKDVDRVDFPNGSIVVKRNAVNADMDPLEPPWLTVMYKLGGYCRADFGGAGNCSGGDWFYYLYRFNNFHYFDGVAAVGKAEPFCIDCHAPVQKGDFLFTTFFDLLHEQQKRRPIRKVKAEKEATENVAKFCEDTPISPELPGDVFTKPSDLEPKQAQLTFDCLSWRSFLALNWPNKPQPAKAGGEPWRGVPDSTKGLDDEGPRVWETYRAIFETFQPDDPNWTLEDQDWHDPAHFDPVCNQDSTGDKVLRLGGKQRYASILDETHQAFGNQFNILIDQNFKQVLFEVRINRDEFEYFKANGYATTGAYDVGGPLEQLSWRSEALQFPDNIRGVEKIGAIEIKAAWRQLCTDPEKCTRKLDDPRKYYTRDAVRFVRDPSGGAATCEPVSVGLVGFHIGHKTFWSPQWVWSTFEHVENVPPAGQFPTADSSKTPYGLYSPQARRFQPSIGVCQGERPGVFEPAPKEPTKHYVAACPNLQSIANSHPADIPVEGGAPTRMEDDSLSPNQVNRIDPMSKSPLNVSYPELLKKRGSVFQYYRLVNTQWPLHGRGKNVATDINMQPCLGTETSEDCFSLIPPGLALRNTSLETYQVSYNLPKNNPFDIKKDVNGQYSSAGCMQCHGPTGLDFSFAWTDAVEEPVPLRHDDLGNPPRGSYLQTCSNATMEGAELKADCRTLAGGSTSSALTKAHSCSGDIANINGKLICNPPVGSFALTCNQIDLQGSMLSAQCLKRDGTTRLPASLNIKGFEGVIENCDGVLTKGRCG